MPEEAQVFKSDATEWIYHHNAYDKDAVKQIPSHYRSFNSIISDCNDAIANSGLNGMSVHGVGPVDLKSIEVKPSEGDSAKIETKITKLNKFCSLIHEECRQQVDNPFKTGIDALLESVGDHSSFTVNCGEGFGELDFDQVDPEEIRQWLESQMSMYDEESTYLTGDEDVDYYINYYSQRQPGKEGKYNYEYALENWDNLTEDQQQALYHIYEYYLRKCEADVTCETPTYKHAKEVVDRMNQYLYTYEVVTNYDDPADSYFNETSACTGMAGIASKKEFSHSEEIFNDIIDFQLGDVTVSDGNGGIINTHVDKKGYYSDDPDVFTLTINGDKAGMRLTLTYSFSDEELQGFSESQDIGYYVPQGRAYAYMKEEEKKNPGCYDHMKHLGFDNNALMGILMSSENTCDMDVFDNLTKGNGDYGNVFTQNIDNLSESGKQGVTNFVILMQSAYATTGDRRYEEELNSINAFYGDAENANAGGYYEDFFLRYYDYAKDFMTQDEKAAVWASPLYKMTDEELAEAKVIAKQELDKFDYRPGDVPVIHSAEEQARYELYVSLSNKSSKVSSVSLGVMTPILNLADFAIDGAEWLIGTSLENDAQKFDAIFGTDVLSSVKAGRERYAQMSDMFMNSMKKEEQNAAVQNAGYYAGGKLAGNLLLYMATSPAFGEAATAMGVKSAAGKFIVNQIGQNAQDILLDTRVLYEDLTADGDLSKQDQIELIKNMGVNAGFNLLMGGAEESIKAYKSAKNADALVDTVKSYDNTPDIIKSVGEAADGKKLVGAAAEADDFFKGENFKAADSFNDSVDAAKREVLVKNNSNCTCPLDANLDSALKSNPGKVDPADFKELQDLRQTVPDITPDTVMQKVIPKQTVDGLMNEGWDTVRGCTSKAADAAPFTGSAEQAYRNLRLDYNTTPYKEIVENGDDIYILRYTTDDVPKNLDYPKLDPKYGPPCTETGFLGSSDYLIPEYTHTSPAKITDGAIYKVSPDGTEKMVGYWDAGEGKFTSPERALIPGKDGVVSGGNSTALGKNMMESMGMPRSTTWPGHQAQHIIPVEMADHPIIQKIGMDLDDASNGLFLRVPGDDISTMARHKGYHSVYNSYVRQALDGMDINKSNRELLREVYDLQNGLRYLQMNGLPLYKSQGASIDLWIRSMERIIK